jgi:hypothetical protein
MSPEGDKILLISLQRLASEIGPMLTTAFAQGQLSLTGFMMTLVAGEFERGADLRANENADIRKLFAALAPIVKDGALRGKLEAAARETDMSLKISDLDKANWALRRLLIELQTHIETLGSAREANKKIWALLRSIGEKRAVRLG